VGTDPPSGVTAKFIGYVRAPDEETAREIAIEQFQIRPEQQPVPLDSKALTPWHAQLAAIPDGFARRTQTGPGAIIRVLVSVVVLECRARFATNRLKASDLECRKVSRR
jgi:hypothetical protein